MKKIIICLTLLFMLHPAASFSEKIHIYTDSDLEKYKSPSSDKAYTYDQQTKESDYQNYQTITDDSKSKYQKANEDQRRYETERRRSR